MSPTADNNAELDWESQLADYALGAMDPSLSAEFERRLEECRGHVARANEYTYVVGMLGMAAAPKEPSQGHRDRFLARLQATPQEPAAAEPAAILPAASPAAGTTGHGVTTAWAPPVDKSSPVTDLGTYRESRGRRLPALLPVLGAVAAALLIVVGLAGWWTAQDRANSLQAQVAQLSAAKQQAEDQATALRQQLNIPASYIPFGMAGQGTEANSWAVAFIDPKSNDVTMMARGLTALPSDRVYELWWIPTDYPNSQPVAAGTFTPDASGVARHHATSGAPIASYSAVAVTNEPAPGGPSARGPVVMLGKFPTR